MSSGFCIHGCRCVACSETDLYLNPCFRVISMITPLFFISHALMWRSRCLVYLLQYQLNLLRPPDVWRKTIFFYLASVLICHQDSNVRDAPSRVKRRSLVGSSQVSQEKSLRHFVHPSIVFRVKKSRNSLDFRPQSSLQRSDFEMDIENMHREQCWLSAWNAARLESFASPSLKFEGDVKKCKIWLLKPSGFETEQHIGYVKQTTSLGSMISPNFVYIGSSGRSRGRGATTKCMVFPLIDVFW